MSRTRLIEALRRASALALDSNAAEAELLAVAEAVEGACERLESPTAATSATPAFSLETHSFVRGRHHPQAAVTNYSIDGDALAATVIFTALHQNRPGYVHGGMTAAVFDDLLGAIQLGQPGGGPTAQLTVRYRAPVPINTPLDLSARVDRRDGRKIFISGQLTHDGALLAESEALFIGQRPPPADR